jgi:broad specificity phosphatase PhoE
MIYVVRHGQTELNNAFALQGRSDHPLNETGVAQARTTGEELARLGIAFDHAYSSPLQRAIQTAELVAPGAPVTVDQRLIEMDYGPYEGADLKNPAPEIITFFSDFVHNPAPEGMEQLSSVVARTGAFVEELAGEQGNVLVSTHAIAMKGILEYLTPGSNGAYWSKNIANCAVYVVDNHGGSLGVPKELVLG